MNIKTIYLTGKYPNVRIASSGKKILNDTYEKSGGRLCLHHFGQPDTLNRLTAFIIALEKYDLTDELKEELNIIKKEIMEPSCYMIIDIAANMGKDQTLSLLKDINEKHGGVIKSIYQIAANKYRKKKCPKSRMLKYGELHPLCANFMGPGTRIDLKEVRDAKPVNHADACAKKHDIAYWKSKSPYDIREADIEFLKCIGDKEDIYSKIGRFAIGKKMSIEDYLPFLQSVLKDYYGKKK